MNYLQRSEQFTNDIREGGYDLLKRLDSSSPNTSRALADYHETCRALFPRVMNGEEADIAKIVDEIVNLYGERVNGVIN